MRDILMIDGLYNITCSCPVCIKKFEVTKVKSKACRVSTRDADFCTHYENLNPMLYDVWVCESCGYAGLSDKFSEVSPNEADTIKKNISVKWNKRSYAGERSVDAAIDAFKLALLSLQI